MQQTDIESQGKRKLKIVGAEGNVTFMLGVNHERCYSNRYKEFGGWMEKLVVEMKGGKHGYVNRFNLSVLFRKFKQCKRK